MKNYKVSIFEPKAKQPFKEFEEEAKSQKALQQKYRVIYWGMVIKTSSPIEFVNPNQLTIFDNGA